MVTGHLEFTVIFACHGTIVVQRVPRRILIHCPRMSQAPLLSLRELQRRALLKLLNLNTEEETQQNTQTNGLGIIGDNPVWKFLVFDQFGQNVISSVLRVSDLREAGVTVHMQLKADRQQMEDVPASISKLSYC